MSKRKTRKSTSSCRKLPCTVEKANHQTGKSNLKYDKRKKALPPGKRISKSGKVYYEYRKNRSDLTPDEIPSSIKKRIRQGLKSRKHGKVVMEHDKCIVRGSIIRKAVFMPPESAGHIPWVGLQFKDGKEYSDTWLKARDYVSYHYGADARKEFNRMKQACWAHPGIALWDKLFMTAKAWKYPKPGVSIEYEPGHKITFVCREGKLKPYSAGTELTLSKLETKLSEKELSVLLAQLRKYNKILCKSGE